ncbi:hypothetical protein JNK13_04745 [bacterium]|nr:hypothetical protein [bacterium]
MAENISIEDPCGEFGPTQRWALVWFVAVLAIGSFATYTFSQTDRWMYDNNAEFLDYQAYRENRNAIYSLAAERVDERAHRANLAHAEQSLDNQVKQESLVGQEVVHAGTDKSKEADHAPTNQHGH